MTRYIETGANIETDRNLPTNISNNGDTKLKNSQNVHVISLTHIFRDEVSSFKGNGAVTILIKVFQSGAAIFLSPHETWHYVRHLEFLMSWIAVCIIL